ncbi:MAG: tRNA uridine-5-carboxymethylaminomethyl(34) synthesis GTPase MnmE [Ignavibacteriales bacterium]|nr:MAG: tRNA uridine-5-carboxymethylaminomethyl(34) synthesis GTPase MnmE [Ignavibacteriales bacterium]
MSEDIITAIATPAGIGAISVIRVSGKDCVAEVDKIFDGKAKLINADSHTVHYGKIIDIESRIIDDCLVTVFVAPHSYTGEDSVEISTHGNPLITQKIVETLISQNIRIAEPGEFTKRAFLNGRIDLTQAEAVVDIINSRSDAALRGARNQLNGLLSVKVELLKNELTNISSYIELELDFAEEDVSFISKDILVERISKVIFEIDNLLSTFKFNRTVRDGFNVAIVGAPNVGKSSLLNYILKESRAIVSEIPGTTRDIIREEVIIDGQLYRFYDTAGLHNSTDPIELTGMNLTLNTAKSSDLVLLVSDNAEDEFLDIGYSTPDQSNTLRILNKIDIKRPNDHNFDVLLSAKTGEGIDELFTRLKEKAFSSSGFTEKGAVVSNIRHYQCLTKSKDNLSNALVSITEDNSGEFITQHIRFALTNLSEIIGEVTSDDILNNIFRNFCIGK